MDEKPNANTGKAWSEMDISDLKECLRFCDPPAKIAAFLRRTEGEVWVKIKTLGLPPHHVRSKPNELSKAITLA